MNQTCWSWSTSPKQGNQGPLLEPDLGGKLTSEYLVAGLEITTWRHHPVGQPHAWMELGSRLCQPGVRQRQDPRYSDPCHHLGTWRATSLEGKEPEVVWEVEPYQLDIAGLTSTHSTGFRTKLRERGWTLIWSCSG